MADFSLKGTLALESRQFVRGAKDAEKAIEDTGEALEDTGDDADDTVKRLDKINQLKIDLDLDDARADLEQLKSRAGDAEDALDDVDDTRVSPDIDTSGIDRAEESTKGMSETAQRGIGPLRGFTDELGEGAGEAGILGNAMIDGGEAIEIFGEKVGLSEETIGKLSGAMVGLGAAVAAGTALWTAYNNEQQRAKERGEDLVDIQKQLADEEFADAAENLSEKFGDFFRFFEDQGVSAAEVIAHLRGENTDLESQLDGMSRQTLKALEMGWQGANEEAQRQVDVNAEIETALRATDGEITNLSGGFDTIIGDLERFGATALSEADLARRKFEELDAAINLERSLLRAEQSFTRTMRSIDSDAGATRLEVLDLKAAVNDFALAAEDVPEEVISDIQAKIDEGSYRVAEARLKVLTARQTKTIEIVTVRRTDTRFLASGGDVSRGDVAVVGEKGPELVAFGAAGRVFSHIESNRIAASARTVGAVPAAPTMTQPSADGGVEVRVFIGDEELRGMIDTQMVRRADLVGMRA